MVFAAGSHDNDFLYRLYYITKLKAAANFYDPAWGQYFECRWGNKMINTVKGRAKLYRVLMQQSGKYCACFRTVTKETLWHSRHILKLGHRGTDAAANLEIYHLWCPRHVQFANVDDV